MKKEYWIKKDPTKNGQDNWIKLNSFEFYKFVNTAEGAVRRKNVELVPYGEPTETMIYMEVDEKTAQEWKSIANGDYYQAQVREELGISVISYHGIQTDDEELTGEDMLVDADCDVEDEVMLKIQKEELRRALKKLNRKEIMLIEAMYLSEAPLTEEEYSLVLGTSRQYVHKLKRQILKKLHFLLIS